MADKIEVEQVVQTAKLGRLELDAEERQEFSHQLSEILAYVQKLNEVDTDGVEPLAHCLDVFNVFGEDVPRESLPTEDILANAPARHENYFRVPKILQDQSGT